MTDRRYPNVSSQPDLPTLERAILDRWAADDTFQQSLDLRPAGHNGDNEFVFYDGPPFANGLPHYGHLLTGYVKDAVPRYQTMRGRHVQRRFGWDCHGLPAEVQVEKELGISGHPEIAAFGIDKFNQACRTSVLRYTQEWEDYVTRQARWVDFENDYKTLDTDYMESVMWALKTLWDKGLMYEGHRVLWYCWHCETPLSMTETRMDDTYRARQDPAVTVSFPLVAPGTDLDGVGMLIWTTTPWTLPSNLAAAVHPDVEYVVVEPSETAPAAGERYLLAEARVGAYARELGDEPTIVGRYRGTDLVGTRYRPPFDFFADVVNAHQVLPAEYVTTEDGTGVVHIAPAFGEEDKIVTDAANIAVVNPVDQAGKFTVEVPPYEGMHVFDANKQIITDLRTAGRLLRHETYDHSYPHCWRCDSPLIQRAVSSWFIEVTKFRDRMVELNQGINWVPGHIKDGQFGKWLENARDWNISRNRFWGSPIPVWKSDNPEYPRTDVYGSIAELEADFGVRLTDLHRPAVDELVRPNPDDPTGQSMMRRVPEVLDCWFESGAMPFAQVHYPFENRDWFDHHYPGDFIVEYMAQTRGWFYTMHVLATALFDRPAFSNCVSHGIVLGDDGRKMSKSLRNYPDPTAMFDIYGADAVRWFLLSSPILRGTELSVTETGIRDTVRHVILPFWNAYYFLTLYANAEGIVGQVRTDQTDVLDRYLLSEMKGLVESVTVQLDAYDLFGACESIAAFFDTLTNWYIRRSRDRFWSGDQDAIDTLHTALVTVCQVAAPVLPLVTEHIYKGLCGDDVSVHLADWPDPSAFPFDADLVAGMNIVRDASSTLLSLRKANGLRVRLPLNEAVVATPAVDLVSPHVDILRDELNVKNVVLTDDLDAYGTKTLVLNPKTLGPRLGGQTQKVIGAHKAGDWSVTGDVVVCGGITLEPGEYEFRVASADAGAVAALKSNDGLVVLDTEVTPELEREGAARDLVRLVQQARRDADLNVSDRIDLVIGAPAATIAALEAHRDLVASETLATSIVSSVVDDTEAVAISVTVAGRA